MNLRDPRRPASALPPGFHPLKPAPRNIPRSKRLVSLEKAGWAGIASGSALVAQTAQAGPWGRPRSSHAGRCPIENCARSDRPAAKAQFEPLPPAYASMGREWRQSCNLYLETGAQIAERHTTGPQNSDEGT